MASLRPNQAHEFSPQNRHCNSRFDEERAEIVSSDKVRMEMENHLPSSAIHIDKEPVARLGHTHLLGNLFGHPEQMVYDVVAFRYVVKGRDM